MSLRFFLDKELALKIKMSFHVLKYLSNLIYFKGEWNAMEYFKQTKSTCK